jgi:hypothetical protein
MQPLAPFSSYLFMVSALAAVLLLIVIFAKEVINVPLVWACIFAVATAMVSGGITLFQTTSAGTSGVIAETVPALKQLQVSVGLIREDLADIKETGQRTAEGVEKIAESTKEIALTLTDISKSFEALSQSGGIVAKPEAPADFYHNARVYESQAKFTEARQAYIKFFSFGTEFLDPHLRFQDFLKLQEGKAGAREAYTLLTKQFPSTIGEYAKALLFESPVRQQMIEAFIVDNPDFAPAYYELSLENSELRKGMQSLADKQAEYSALKLFIDLDKNGEFVRYFLDKTVAIDWLDDVEARLTILEAQSALLERSPITVTVAADQNSKVWVTIEPVEPAREIFYRLPGKKYIRASKNWGIRRMRPDEWVGKSRWNSTGITDSVDQETGHAIPIKRVHLNIRVSKETIVPIDIKYVAVGGKLQGPFKAGLKIKKRRDGSQEWSVVDIDASYQPLVWNGQVTSDHQDFGRCLNGACDGMNFRGLNLTKRFAAREESRMGRLFPMSFETADLASANLNGLTFLQSNFFAANLKGATLVNSTLARSNLEDVNLVGADLTGANLAGANMTDANLSEAILIDTNFEGAILCHTMMPGGTEDNTGCDLRRRFYQESEILPTMRSRLVVPN